MMEYKRPSKAQRDVDYLRNYGMPKPENAYQEDTVPISKRFLIICEGQNTEKYYFEKFRVPSADVKIIGGCNSKNSLVDYALQLKRDEKYEGWEVWCVFDFDIKPDEAATQPHDFNSSIEKAERNGMMVAWSNDAFELWFLLHYQYLDTCITRHEINPLLKEKWGLDSFHNTVKTVGFTQGMYELLGGEQSTAQKTAIKNAKRLHDLFKGEGANFAEHCPCTTVYLLVEELNRYLKA